MGSFERTQVIGYVGRDPEKRVVGDSQVANFSLAVTDKYTDKSTGELRESTNWYSCAVWGKQADVIMQYVKKGHNIMLEGKPTARAYTGSDGEPKASLELRVYSFTFLGGGSDNAPEDTADIPF